LAALILIISLDCRLAKHHVSLEKFVIDHDAEVYGRHLLKTQINGHSPIQELEKLVHLRIDNSFQSIPDFHAHLDFLDLLNVDRLRPQWDTYFMVGTAVSSFLSHSPLPPFIPSSMLRDPVHSPFPPTPTITITLVLLVSSGGAANDLFWSLATPLPPKKKQHLASLASRRSNCMKRRVGAILVRNNRVVGTGYVTFQFTPHT